MDRMIRASLALLCSLASAQLLWWSWRRPIIAGFADLVRHHLLKKTRPKRIILIRHGESEGNLDSNVFCFMPDSRIPLTKRGREQAHEAGAKLAEIVGDTQVRFWVSPYRRTRQTLEIMLEHLKPCQVSVREEPRLREQDWGNFQNLEEIAECRRVRNLFGSFYYRFPSGESGADVFDRVSSFLETMFRDFMWHPENETAVIVSHGLTCRLFLMRYLHWRVEKFQRTVNLENCEMAVLRRRVEDGRLVLVKEIRTHNDQVDDEWDTLASAARTMSSAQLKHHRVVVSSMQ